MKVTFIGTGNMGSAMAEVACSAIGGENVWLNDSFPEKGIELAKKLGCNYSELEDAVKTADFIVLCVKPQNLPELLPQIRPLLSAEKCVVSIAAGTPIEKLYALFGADGFPIIRLMPNMPVSVRKGMILVAAKKDIDEKLVETVMDLFSSAGGIMRISEELFDIGGTLTGCVPAYVYAFIQGLVEGGVRCGLSKENATKFASCAVEGAAALLSASNKDPQLLKEQVCSKGGTTIEGIKVLENHGFIENIADAVTASYERTLELNRQ